MALGFPRAFRDFDIFPSRLDRLFDEMVRGAFDRPFGGEHRVSSWSPSMEIYEADDEILVEAELPGIEAGDLDVHVENNVLTIRGERKIEDDASRGRPHRQEFFYGTFMRTIALPTTIDQEKVKAELKDGVLRIQLPKSEQTRARQIQIQAAGKTQQLPTSTEGQAPGARESELVGAGSASGPRGKNR